MKRKIIYLTIAAIAAMPALLRAQNVGIGTTTPTEKLQVVGNVKLSDTLKARRVSVGSDSSRYPLAVKAEGQGFAQISSDGTIAVGTYAGQNAAFIQTHSNHDLHFTTNDGPAQMTLQKTTGNVGIGKTNPTEKLDVNGKTKTTNLQVTGGTPGINKILTSDASGNGSWQALGSIASGTNPYDAGSVGYGAWGDCGTNANISGYQPVDVSDLNSIEGVVMDSIFAVVSGTSTSKIYQFDSVQGLWLHTQTLPVSGKLALSKSNLLIGYGAVRLYQYNGTSWVLAQTITSPAPQPNDFFGTAVAISGNEILVGAPYRNIGALSIVGQVYAYSLSGSTATYLHAINSPNPVAGGQFGRSLAISGNKAIIGEPYPNSGTAKGRCYSIRKLTAAVWSNPPIALPEAPPMGGPFAPKNWGDAVAISGDDAMVSGYNGFVMIHKYDPVAGTWDCTRQIRYDGLAGVQVTVPLAMTENFALVGHFSNSATSSPNKAIIYQQLQQGNWQSFQSITDPGGELTYSYKVAISGNRFVLCDDWNMKIMFGKINAPR